MIEPSIASYLGRWEQAFAAGEDLPPEALCPDRPDLHRALRSVCDMMRWMRHDADATASDTPRPGVGPAPRTVAGHEILGELARGGMGVVYRARHLALNRVVALKMILGGGHADADARRRFLTEAEAVARVKHPGIVQIFDHGVHDGLPYFSLEMCAGSLAGRLADGPLPPREAAALVEKVARAVQAAHEAGIVHRDLKPANVLLADDGSPRVADFGLARRLDAASSLPSGAVVGTPSYMAPEQARGDRNVGPLADVYALGALLYACLTGGPPFRSASVMDTMAQVITAEPAPPRSLNPAVPRDLETVCLKALQKEGWRRYPSAAAFADDLKRFAEGRPVAARPVGPLGQLVRWCGRQPVVAALTAGLALALIAGTAASVAFAWRAADKATLAEEKATLAQRKEAEALASEKKAKEREEEAVEQRGKADRERREADLARDHAERLLYFGRIQLAHREIQAGRVNKALERLAECPPALRGWEHGYLLRLCEGSLWTFRPPAATPSIYSSHLAVCPATGRILTRDLRLLDPHAGRVVPSRLPGGKRLTPKCADFSPDGRRLVAVVNGVLTVWDVRTGKTLMTERVGVDPHDRCCFAPDARRVAWGSQKGEFAVFDGTTGKRLADLKTTLPGNYVNELRFSRDGRQLAAVDQVGRTRTWALRTGEETVLPVRARGGIASVRLAADGKTAVGDRGGTIRVYPAKPDAPAQTLRGHRENVNGLGLSPDGRLLASAGRDLSVRIWDLSKGELLQTFYGHRSEVHSVHFLPGGERVVSSDNDGVVKVWDATTHNSSARLVRVKEGIGRLVHDGDRFAAVNLKRSAVIWDRDAGESRLPLGVPEDNAVLAHHPRLGWTVRWDGKPPGRLSLTAHDGGRVGVALAVTSLPIVEPGGRFAVTHEADAAVVRRLPGLEVVTRLPTPDNAPVRPSFDPAGRLVALRLAREVHVRDVATGGMLGRFPCERNGSQYLAFGHGSRLLAVASPKDIQVWDWRAGRRERALVGHTGHATLLAFTPDGARLFSLGEDGTLRVWDVATGTEVLTLDGLTSKQHEALWLGPDGLRLYAADSSEVRLWDGTPP